VNAVLPYIKVDYVSISSYDSQGLLSFGRAKDEAERREMIFSALDYVEDHLPPSEVKGKRVFVGEIGYPVYNVKKFYKMEEGEAQQALMALQNAVINLEWGMPFWIWWALYDNEEISEEDPTYRGFGCFDQVNERERMIFSEFKTFYTWAKNWERKNIRTKTSKNVKFRKDGIQQLRSQIQLLLTKAPASGRRPFRQRS
jgi:hypothetical protein